jgi:hypothetical protein
MSVSKLCISVSVEKNSRYTDKAIQDKGLNISVSTVSTVSINCNKITKEEKEKLKI